MTARAAPRRPAIPYPAAPARSRAKFFPLIGRFLQEKGLNPSNDQSNQRVTVGV